MKLAQFIVDWVSCFYVELARNQSLNTYPCEISNFGCAKYKKLSRASLGGRSVKSYFVALVLCLHLSSEWGLFGCFARSAVRRTPSHCRVCQVTNR